MLVNLWILPTKKLWSTFIRALGQLAKKVTCPSTCFWFLIGAETLKRFPSNSLWVVAKSSFGWWTMKEPESITGVFSLNRACSLCKKGHKACNGGCPCQRCIASGLADRCDHFQLKKKRARQRGSNEAQLAMPSSTSLPNLPSHRAAMDMTKPGSSSWSLPFNESSSSSSCSPGKTRFYLKISDLPIPSKISLIFFFF